MIPWFFSERGCLELFLDSPFTVPVWPHSPLGLSLPRTRHPCGLKTLYCRNFLSSHFPSYHGSFFFAVLLLIHLFLFLLRTLFSFATVIQTRIWPLEGSDIVRSNSPNGPTYCVVCFEILLEIPPWFPPPAFLTDVRQRILFPLPLWEKIPFFLFSGGFPLLLLSWINKGCVHSFLSAIFALFSGDIFWVSPSQLSVFLFPAPDGRFLFPPFLRDLPPVPITSNSRRSPSFHFLLLPFKTPLPLSSWPRRGRWVRFFVCP